MASYLPRELGRFTQIGRGWFLGIPMPAFLALLSVAGGAVVLSQKRYGRQVIAVGANAEAARWVGMPAQKVVASVYIITGAAAALAGIIVAARLSSGSSNAAVGFELDVIAAVVLGGTSLMGGRGTIL